MSVWLIGVPNENGNSIDKSISIMKDSISSTKNDYSFVSNFELPSDLTIGTLDSLMALQDNLHRSDLSIESVVRKIERQFLEINNGDDHLTVDGVPVDRYLSHFSWDEAKHPHRKPLKEIVSTLEMNMNKVEEELKQLSSMYSEKKQQLSSLNRKKGGNLMVANLDEVLTSDVVSEKNFMSSEHLTTLVVVVPSAVEEEWLKSYERIGMDIAEFGPEGKRGSVKGSPVVPNSSKLILKDGDAAIYTVAILKGQYQAGFMDEDGKFQNGQFLDYVELFKVKAREQRFVVRDFEYNPNALHDNQTLKAELQVEVERLWSGILRWCKAHYGEAFIAWMHIKAIRIFVESVLRYGLPVNFAVALVRPHAGKDKKIQAALERKYAHLQPKEFSTDKSDPNAVEYFPYASNCFTPVTV